MLTSSGNLTGLMDPARLLASSDPLPRVDPASDCLLDGQTTLSWAEAIDSVGRLAAALEQCGVVPGDRVGIRMTKSVGSFVSVHAVLRAGGVMVPLDPQAPAAQAAAVIADADVGVVIADARSRDLAAVVDSTSIHSVILPGASSDSFVRGVRAVAVLDEQAIGDATPTKSSPVVASHDPAYIIYTSGSTGRPKGIVHTHASALAYAEAAVRHYELRSDDRFANIAPLHFDQSTFELYAAPMVGGAVLVVPDPVLRFPASLSALIEREQITIWYSVPYLLQQLSARGGLDIRDLSALRWVLFGGESFAPGQLGALMQQLPGATFSNVYGPAEVNQCTAYDLTEPPVDSVPIGRAWDAARVRVVDPDDHATLVADRPGILLVKSPTMMSHYWNRPDLTEASTIVDESGRWYITGDLVEFDPDGQMVFLGRSDNQVKLRGHRIELEAIDELLRDIAGVEAATTVVRRVEAGDDVLVALVVPSESRTDTWTPSEFVADTAAALVNRLPRYAVPASIHLVESLPRTGTGKIDRGASTVLLDDILQFDQTADRDAGTE